MYVEVVRTLDIKTRTGNTFPHDWTNVRAATTRGNTVSANALQKFRNLEQIRSDLRRRSRRETQSLRPVRSGIRLDREDVFRKLVSIRIAIRITATQSVFFIRVKHDADRA